MQEFDISLEILSEILDQNVLFNDALKNKFQKDIAIRPLRPLVAGLVGCELRHHLLFTYLIDGVEKNLPEGQEPLSETERRFLALVLGNNLFFRHLDAEKADEAWKSALSSPEKYDRFLPLLTRSGSVNDLIPESIARSSEQYLSLRYNAPSWALKIWKHFGYGNLYKTLRAFSTHEPLYLRVRTTLISEEEVLANPDFAATSVSGILLYKGKTPLRKLDLYKEGKIYLERPLTKKILDEHKVHEPSEILLYNGNADASLEKELLESYGSAIGLNLATPDVDSKIEITKSIKDMGLHNVNFFSAPDPLSMDASISKKQNLVICAPDSTNFDQIRSTPDFLLRFQRERMDGLLEGEKNALQGCAKYVEKDGLLIYMVYTLSWKESHVAIANFLRDNPEFKLEGDTQFFPYQEDGSALYVALLRHGNGEAENALPPDQASALMQKEAAPSSLASDGGAQ